MALYTIADNIRNLLDQLELAADPETGEIVNEQEYALVADQLDSLSLSFNDKAAAVAAYIKEQKAYADAIKAAKQDMDRRQKAAEKRVDRLKAYLLNQMQATGTKKINSPEIQISVRKTAPALVVFDEQQIPAQYWKPQAPVLDKAGVKAAIKEGADIPGAMLGDASETVVIR